MDINLEKNEIFKVYNNINELIKTRNYKTDYKFDITKNNILNDNVINIETTYNNKQIIFIFIINSEVNIIKKSDAFLKYVSNLEKKYKNLDKLIIISKYKLSTLLNKKIKLLKKNIIIENILFNILIFNPIKHINYNNYSFSLLTDDEKKNLFNLIDYSPNNIHKICIDDPICIYYDFNVNDIIKIIKPTIKTAGTTCSYRIVINKHISNNRNIINKHIHIEEIDYDNDDEADGEEDEDDENKIKLNEDEEENEDDDDENENEDEDDEEFIDNEEDLDLEQIEEVI